jgi:hypothetical protein
VNTLIQNQVLLPFLLFTLPTNTNMSDEVTILFLSSIISLSQKQKQMLIGALYALPSFMTDGMLFVGMNMVQEVSLDTLTKKEGGFLTMVTKQRIIALLIGIRRVEDMFR